MAPRSAVPWRLLDRAVRVPVEAHHAGHRSAAADVLMDMTDPGLKFAKPELRAVRKKIRAKLDAQDEREARKAIKARDGGRCRIPNCRERSHHLHHIVYRSKSKRLRWNTSNLVSLCADHHGLVHSGVLTIAGNADQEIIVTGDVNRLKFRL